MLLVHNHTSIRRNRQELKNLGLLDDDGSLTEEAVEEATPAMPPQPPTNYFDTAINPRYCSEVLWRAGEDPRQCRARPSRGGTKCWRHDENRRTDATAARHRRIQTALTNRRNDHQRRQDDERQKQLDNSRFGSRRHSVMTSTHCPTENVTLRVDLGTPDDATSKTTDNTSKRTESPR
ncbi:hypothetical protein ElyMa_003710600 [Elysia marginata]|uniref:Uncharacterized protein n=1 Tax=Elysia marginata TaxID=1093978 RepID=A0AAV4F5A4_9GAST|nr:hypothetical protein ElyMa_003710600 [Elysia marginata]